MCQARRMTHPRPFRFGVMAAKAKSSAEWTDTAKKAEDLGYSALLMPDHFGDQLSPIPALSMAAAATKALRVGTLVFANDFRHPAVLAKENIRKVELLEYPELGMEAIYRIEVEDFPAFILVDDKGNDFFESL